MARYIDRADSNCHCVNASNAGTSLLLAYTAQGLHVEQKTCVLRVLRLILQPMI